MDGVLFGAKLRVVAKDNRLGHRVGGGEILPNTFGNKLSPVGQNHRSVEFRRVEFSEFNWLTRTISSSRHGCEAESIDIGDNADDFVRGGSTWRGVDNVGADGAKAKGMTLLRMRNIDAVKGEFDSAIEALSQEGHLIGAELLANQTGNVQSRDQ